mgnify:CR=1 FL=1
MNGASGWFQRYLLPGCVFQAAVIAGGYATGRELPADKLIVESDEILDEQIAASWSSSFCPPARGAGCSAWR